MYLYSTFFNKIDCTALFSFNNSNDFCKGHDACSCAQELASFLASTFSNPYIFLIIGMFTDVAGAIAITAPMMMPVIAMFGIDPVHFGVVLVINLSIGLICLLAVMITGTVFAGGLQEAVSSDEPKVTIIPGHGSPDNSFANEGANLLKKLAAERSAGKIVIDNYPAFQLGNIMELDQNVKGGSIQKVNLSKWLTMC